MRERRLESIRVCGRLRSAAGGPRGRWAFPAAIAAILIAASAAFPQPPAAGRIDLGRAYLRLERHLAASPPSAEARREANRRFDGLTMLFFAGRFAAAIESLAELEADLRGLDGEARAVFLAAASQRWSLDPPQAVFGEVPPLSIVATPLGTPQPEAARGVVESFELVGPDGSRWPLRRGEDGRAAFPEDGLPPWSPGRWRLEAMLPQGRGGIEVASLDLLSAPLEARRASLERRLAAVSESSHPQDLDLLKSRLALLEGSSPASTAGLLLGPELLLDELDEEVASVEAGRRAHAGLVGHRWRTVSLGGFRLPLRVFVPSSVRRGDAAVPLLIVLHGAGGDEHMFPDGYGGGLVARLAEERGFVVASPLTTVFATGGFLEPLLEEMAAMAPIDPARIHLVGHSMGAAAAARIASMQPDRIASIALIAGNPRFDPARPPPPALVVAGEFDPLAPASRVGPAATAARRQGMEVDFESIAGAGHTLVVAESLPMAVAWLLARPQAP
jgi:predicted esterase